MTTRRARVLIIKTGHAELLEARNGRCVASLGDVLAATALLNLYRDCDVTWLTDRAALPLLARNRHIGRLLAFDARAIRAIQREPFDTIVNLEKAPRAIALLRRVGARQTHGFSAPHPPRAATRATATLPEILFEMVGERWRGQEYVLDCPPREACDFDVGLNTEVGPKWPTKRWPVRHWDALETRLVRAGLRVTRQDRYGGRILRSIPAYIDWVNASRILVTGDTLGLHLGLALGKRVVALFGPTPHRRIQFFGRGTAVLPQPPPVCAPCLKPECDRPVTCMAHIQPERVFRCVCAMIRADPGPHTCIGRA